LDAIKSIKNKTDIDLLAIAKTGVGYHYPACCIYAFCEDLSNGESPGEKRGLDYEGFIPCGKHCERLKNDIGNLKNLRVNHGYAEQQNK